MEINFGISSYSRYSPGVPWEERIIVIPKATTLPCVKCRQPYLDQTKSQVYQFYLPNFTDVRANLFTLIPAVGFLIDPEKTGDNYDMYLLWIEERREWLAFVHRAWSESDLSVDEAEYGPYSLDDYCKHMLARAFEIEEEKIPSWIEKKSPHGLEKEAGIVVEKKVCCNYPHIVEVFQRLTG